MLICTEGLFWNDEIFGWALGFYREANQAIVLNVRQLTAEFTVYIYMGQLALTASCLLCITGSN